MSITSDHLIVRDLGLSHYEPTLEKMISFSQQRDENTADEIWLLEHPPVYTLGKNGKAHHVLNPGKIPIVQIDRGGQVTYHGPGQLIAYLLIDIRRKNMGVRHIVTVMEKSIIHVLAELGVEAKARADAPGVYVNDAKIAALGLRIKNGKSYHGLSFNIDMDLRPFQGINPCGYEGLHVTQLSELLPECSMQDVMRDVKKRLIENLKTALDYEFVTLQ